jgi:hypothetical protein
MESRPKRRKNLKDVNDDNILVINSSRVVFEVNERGKLFYIALRNIVKRMYRCSFHLQYKINPVTPIIKLYVHYKNRVWSHGQ